MIQEETMSINANEMAKSNLNKDSKKVVLPNELDSNSFSDKPIVGQAIFNNPLVKYICDSGADKSIISMELFNLIKKHDPETVMDKYNGNRYFSCIEVNELDQDGEKTDTNTEATQSNAEIIAQNPSSMTVNQFKSLREEQVKDLDVEWIIDLKTSYGDNIRRLKTTPFHPQCDGQSERTIQTIKNMIKAYIDVDQLNWDLCLNQLAFAFNSSVHASTNQTSFEMISLSENESIDSVIQFSDSENDSQSAGSESTNRITQKNSSKTKGVYKKVKNKPLQNKKRPNTKGIGIENRVEIEETNVPANADSNSRRSTRARRAPDRLKL
ncbi:unnamed protein product [Brachionus calyciflorus]|uniref:Integrase catalytic domain-containing protein n=1 Tax=Brachionus calyciflorus TaxID=104777 RepID=A0A813UMM5_9BILA|nr:unnamed protein product [Brachionus calyciflorus]